MNEKKIGSYDKEKDKALKDVVRLYDKLAKDFDGDTKKIVKKVGKYKIPAALKRIFGASIDPIFKFSRANHQNHSFVPIRVEI